MLHSKAILFVLIRALKRAKNFAGAITHFLTEDSVPFSGIPDSKWSILTT